MQSHLSRHPASGQNKSTSMNRQLISSIFAVVFLALTARAGYSNEPLVKASLQAVTIYGRGAEMVHEAKVPLKAGLNEIVIENISNSLQENTIQVGGSGNISILSIKFTTDYLQPVKVISPAVKKWQDSVVLLRRDLRRLVIAYNIANEALGIIIQNKDLKGMQTAFTTAELGKMVEYYRVKGAELQNEMADLKEKQEKLQTIINALENQINVESTKPGGKNVGHLVLKVQSESTISSNFTISYITDAAQWYPYYDLRAESITTPLKLIYKARVMQTTGLDWKQVKMSLSTANPNQSGNAPVLSAWFLTYVYENTRRSMNNYYRANNAFDFKASGEKEKSLTGAVQNITAEDLATVAENTLSTQFDLDTPYDISSDGQDYSVTMKEYKINAGYQYYSVPKLTKDVFLLATISDWEELNLLPGEANIIFEGTYIGKSMIDPLSTLDTLNLTMGRDKRVVVKKEKVNDFSKTKSFGNDKVQTLTYTITVKNNKKDAINMVLKDQFPLSSNKDIVVEQLESTSASINTETGIATWMVELKPGESKSYTISYKVRYPKGKMINL
jgi:uncharacterized protein (TIGR02231 family)